MAAWGLHAVSAHGFLLDLADLDESSMAAVIVDQARAAGRPPMTPAGAWIHS